MISNFPTKPKAENEKQQIENMLYFNLKQKKREREGGSALKSNKRHGFHFLAKQSRYVIHIETLVG